MTIAERIRELRLAAALTQEAVAERAEVPVESLRGIEQGRRQPTWPTLRRIAGAIGVSLGDFDGLDDEPRGPAKKRRRKKS